jgi:hypothetical protein
MPPCQPGGLECVNRGLVMVVRREPAPRNSTRRGEVNRELVRDRGMLLIGDSFRCKQRRKHVAVLAGFARGKRSK